MFLLKEGVSEEEILEPSHVPKATAIDTGGGTVYTQGLDPRPPAWAAFFGNLLDPAALGLMTVSKWTTSGRSSGPKPLSVSWR